MGVHFHSQFRNPLAYPAGYAPGFDPSHPAAVAGPVLFSAAAIPGGMIDILTGKTQTLTNSPVPGINGMTGPYLDSATNGTCLFAGKSTVLYPAVTLAAIFTSNGAAEYSGIMSSGTASNNGHYLHFQNSASLYFGTPGVVDTPVGFSGANFVTGESYFAVLSGQSSGIRGVATRLKTGQVFTGSGSGLTIVASNGTMGFGANSGLGGNVRVSAGAVIGGALSISQQAAWAADPWSFWYPNPGDNWIAAQSSAFPYWAVQNNNFVIGTGIQ